MRGYKRVKIVENKSSHEDKKETKTLTLKIFHILYYLYYLEHL